MEIGTTTLRSDYTIIVLSDAENSTLLTFATDTDLPSDFEICTDKIQNLILGFDYERENSSRYIKVLPEFPSVDDFVKRMDIETQRHHISIVQHPPLIQIPELGIEITDFEFVCTTLSKLHDFAQIWLKRDPDEESTIESLMYGQLSAVCELWEDNFNFEFTEEEHNEVCEIVENIISYFYISNK